MNDIFKKTRELGEALMSSDEYLTMKAAEERAMKNHDAAETMAEYVEAKQALEIEMQSDSADMEVMQALSGQVELLGDKLQSIAEVAELNSARSEFSNLISQVNQVLRFVVTGDMGGGNEGCGQDCGSCGGCRTIN